MPKNSPISFLLEHRNFILEVYEKNNRKISSTWEELQHKLPGLSGEMRPNTFKQYMSVIIVFSYELDKVIQERDRVIQKLDSTSCKNKELEKHVVDIQEKLNRVIRNELDSNGTTQQSDNSIKRINGWSIQKSKDGYYRCYRKINNKVHSVYIGKKLDCEKARVCIAEKEKRLGLYNG